MDPVWVIVAGLVILFVLWLLVARSREPQASILDEANDSFVRRSEPQQIKPVHPTGLTLEGAIGWLVVAKERTLVPEDDLSDKRIPKRLFERHAWSVRLSNEEFEQLYEAKCSDKFERCFFTTLAGVQHLNADGSRRDVVIARCRNGEQLCIVHDEGNAFSDTAMLVTRPNGEQLGFIPERTAKEIHREMFKRNIPHAAIFAHANFKPADEQLVGATVLIVQEK